MNVNLTLICFIFYVLSFLFFSLLYSFLFHCFTSQIYAAAYQFSSFANHEPFSSVPFLILSALCRCLSTRFQCLSLHLVSSPSLFGTHHISSLSSRSDATLCLRGSELIISFQHDSFSGRLHSVPWLIISVLCRFFSLLIHAMPFQSISVLCHNFSGRCCSNLILSTLSLSYSVHGLFFCNATLFLRLSWLFFTHPPLYCSSLHYSLPSLAISLLRLFHA